MDANRMPKYLENDCIKDSIVELFYETLYNLDYLQKRLVEIIDEYPSEFHIIPQRKVITTTEGKEEVLDNVYLANNDYKVIIKSDRISFNCITKYQGWNLYSKLISFVIERMSQEVFWTSCSIRYVSLFENISVFDNVDGDLKLKRFPRIEGTEFSFNFHILKAQTQISTLKAAQAFVKLTNKIPFNNSFFSAVDVVVSIPSDVKSLKEDISFIHEQEKVLFFSLLSESFINTLGPHYE